MQVCICCYIKSFPLNLLTDHSCNFVNTEYNYIEFLHMHLLRKKYFLLNQSCYYLLLMLLNFREGYVVIKVFVVHDPSLPLQSYQQEITRISRALSGFPNVLPFQRSLLTERAGLLIRQFVHDNLYDRIR